MASLVRNCYGLSGCLPPWSDQTGILPQPPETFTSRLPTGRSPFPPLDMTTTSTGLLCRRDLHPLEWQLASLHGQSLPWCPAPGPPDARCFEHRDMDQAGVMLDHRRIGVGIAGSGIRRFPALEALQRGDHAGRSCRWRCDRVPHAGCLRLRGCGLTTLAPLRGASVDGGVHRRAKLIVDRRDLIAAKCAYRCVVADADLKAPVVALDEKVGDGRRWATHPVEP